MKDQDLEVVVAEDYLLDELEKSNDKNKIVALYDYLMILGEYIDEIEYND